MPPCLLCVPPHTHTRLSHLLGWWAATTAAAAAVCCILLLLGWERLGLALECAVPQLLGQLGQELAQHCHRQVAVGDLLFWGSWEWDGSNALASGVLGFAVRGS